MPNLSYVATLLPGIVIGAFLPAALGLGKDLLIQKKTHTRASLGKWYDRRIEKLEAISRTCWALDRQATKLFGYGKDANDSSERCAIDEIRTLQTELEILTQFYAPDLIEFRISAEKAMTTLEGRVRGLKAGAQDAVLLSQAAEALIAATDQMRFLRNGALTCAKEYLDPADNRHRFVKSVEVHRREEYFAANPTHRD